jgi:hypothetical protein
MTYNGDPNETNPYVLQRNARIEANNARLKKLGLLKSPMPADSKPVRRRSVTSKKRNTPVRSSLRLIGKVRPHYKEINVGKLGRPISKQVFLSTKARKSNVDKSKVDVDGITANDIVFASGSSHTF